MGSVSGSRHAPKAGSDGKSGEVESGSGGIMNDFLYYLVPVAFVLFVLIRYVRKKRHHYEAAKQVLDEAIQAGLTEPPSLHPVIDPIVCCGSGACVRVCPEKALGLINHKAVLINPTHCIGHGACAPACPVGAIKLVFGTEKRGVDIPLVKPNFETNVPGIYAIGDVTGKLMLGEAVTAIPVASSGYGNISHTALRK